VMYLPFIKNYLKRLESLTVLAASRLSCLLNDLLFTVHFRCYQYLQGDVFAFHKNYLKSLKSLDVGTASRSSCLLNDLFFTVHFSCYQYLQGNVFAFHNCIF